MTRRQILFLSLAVSVVLHAILLAVAPMVSMLRPSDDVPSVLMRYRVNLAEAARPPVQPRQPLPERTSLQPRATAPEQREQLAPTTNLLELPADTPDLAQRAAADRVERPADAAPDPALMRLADARIIEISQEEAREGLSVERRLVRPSPDRILPEGATPTLRSPIEDRGELLAIAAAAPSALAGTPDFAEPSLDPPFLPFDEFGEDGSDPLRGLDARLPLEGAPIETLTREIESERDYDFLDDLVAIELETYQPNPSEPGYFRLRILPRTGEHIPVLPKDVTFVIDSSNSIIQRKLDLTARGLDPIIATLRPEDHFNIISFRDTANLFRPQRVPATPEATRDARGFLQSFESRGQTDIFSALEPVLQEPYRDGMAGMVVFISDGQPTSGIRDGRTIINGLTTLNTHDISILAYGGGNTVNRNLLDLLAHRNRGDAYVTPNMNQINDELPRFLGLFSDPILVNLNANFSGIRQDELYPRRLPDFFKGRPVVVHGRFDPSQDETFAMRLVGRAADRTKEVIFRADLDEARTGDVSIANEWAFNKAYHLIGRMVEEGEQPALRAELRSLSQRYGIQTSYDD